jgi:NADPH2:quinone reductase
MRCGSAAGVVINTRPRAARKPSPFRAARFDRAPGAIIYTLNQFDKTTAHASGTGDLTRLCALIADGRLDGQVELESSWREPTPALDALLHRRIGGKTVLHVD